MADCRSLGCAGKPSVRDQGDGLSKLRVRGNCLRGVEHLRHPGSLRPLITDEHCVSRLNPVGDHRRNGILLAVKGLCPEHGPEHFLRHCGMLDHGALRSQIPPQNPHGSVRSDGICKGADHVGPLDSPLFEIAPALVIKAVCRKLLQILSQSLSRHGHHVKMQHGFDFLHHGRNASRIIEELRRPPARRTDIQKIMGSPVHAVKSVRIDLDPQLVGCCRDVEQGVRGTRDRCMNHDRIFKGFPGHDVAGLNSLFHQLDDLFSRLISHLLQILAGCRHERGSRKHQSKGFRHDLHGGGGSHKGAGSAGRTGIVLVIGQLFLRDLPSLAHGRISADLL